MGDALSPPPRHDQHTIVADPTKSRERAGREPAVDWKEELDLEDCSVCTGSLVVTPGVFGSTVTVLFAFIFIFGEGS
jgi:hypothetical protein